MTAPATRPRRRARILAAALAVALTGGLLGACTAPNPYIPQAVLNVPGSYTANLWDPVIGGASATVLLCLDTPSAVELEVPGGGSIKLEWAGATYGGNNGGGPFTGYTTPVIQPGCGILNFGVDCCHVDHYLTVTATKV
jgi:hypothetical protein